MFVSYILIYILRWIYSPRHDLLMNFIAPNKMFMSVEVIKNVFKFLVRLHGEYNILVKLCGNIT